LRNLYLTLSFAYTIQLVTGPASALHDKSSCKRRPIPWLTGISARCFSSAGRERKIEGWLVQSAVRSGRVAMQRNRTRTGTVPENAARLDWLMSLTTRSSDTRRFTRSQHFQKIFVSAHGADTRTANCTRYRIR
jgi:hypothetical protein